jgi:hypothetical protein
MGGTRTSYEARHMKVGLWIAAGVLATGCGPTDTAIEKEKASALAIANKFVRTELKDKSTDYTVRIHDDGDAWIISYHTPPGETGGGPLVILHKETRIVTAAYLGGQ